MKTKIFLDDVRDVKVCFGHNANRVYLEEGWLTVKTYEEFVQAVKEHFKDITHISFDHDLADEHYDIDSMCDEVRYNALYSGFKEKTGLDCARWFKEYYSEQENPPDIEILVHSMNPVGAKNIKQVFE